MIYPLSAHHIHPTLLKSTLIRCLWTMPNLRVTYDLQIVSTGIECTLYSSHSDCLSLLELDVYGKYQNINWHDLTNTNCLHRPWPHTIFIPLIWFFSAVFAVPTVFWCQCHNNFFYSFLAKTLNKLERLSLASHFSLFKHVQARPGAYLRHGYKTRVQMPAKMFPRLKLIC